MEPAKVQQQILSSNKTAVEKARDLLLERVVNEMSKHEWQELIAGIPEDVVKENWQVEVSRYPASPTYVFTPNAGSQGIHHFFHVTHHADSQDLMQILW